MQIINAFRTEDINFQVQQILGSPAFRNSPTLTKFLTYIISEKLFEREQHLKEYNIAISVLNRSRDFNPQDDAVVRIHAGRLRRALNEYYLIQGINDPIIIHIPKGGYIPHFEVGGTVKPTGMIPSEFSEQVINPIVAVFPFRTLTQKQHVKTFSNIIPEQISAELSKFQDITVIGYYTREMLALIEQNILEAGKSINADYIITGSVQSSDQNLWIVINLLVAATGEVMMVKSFEKKGVDSDNLEIQEEIVQSVVGTIGGYHTLIFQDLAKAFPGKVFN
ncbi:MAG: hypothetical protein ACXWCG_12340 [Flavitalea sp.]